MDFAAGFTFKVKRFKFLEDIKDAYGKTIITTKIRKNQLRAFLRQQLPRLWNTDFKDLNAWNCVVSFIEDSVKLVDRHFQVALPWQKNPHQIFPQKNNGKKKTLLPEKSVEE